jgi:histidinol-phosphate aminotransferase
VAEDGDAKPWLGALRPELEGLSAYVPHVPANIRVKLDANEAPPLTAPEVREAVLAAVAGVALERYPDPTCAALKEAIALRTGAKTSDLFCGTGSDEVIALLVNAMARPRGRAPQAIIVALSPTFVMYRITARAHGVKCVEVPLDREWDVDVRSTSRAIEMMQPNVVFVASPNNPTGNAMSEDRLRELVALAKDSVFVIDEAYGDYAGRSLRALREEHANVAVLRTVSKLGLAALRVGWLEADEALVRELDKARQPFNVSATSQAAAAAVMTKAWGVVTAHVARVIAERERVAAELARYPGVLVTPSAANFLWIKTERPAEDVMAELARRGVLVRSFHQAGGRLAQQLRVTIGAPDDNAAFLQALASALAT